MSVVLVLAALVPAVGALVVRVAPRPGAVAVLVAALSAIPAGALLVAAADGERSRTGLTWLPAAGLRVGLRLDALSAAMSATVAGVGIMVLLYAAGYFTSDARRGSALAGLLAFLAAMQGLVLADGYLSLLIGWELVGAASARLIAFPRTDAGDAGAVRAFLTTRSADAGLYLAVLALLTATGSLAFTGDRPSGALGTVVALGLIVAAAGKSAQVPLQGWLGGAMAGPTPVSALLHSATMVAAGVYLLVRSAPLLHGWPLVVIGYLGATTAVVGALIALTERDLKRVLAGSTSSHLGLMLLGLAAGGPAVAIFHLVAHAVGKSGLFLAAGIFQHARGSTDLRDLRGAGRDDPWTFGLFTVCGASIAAVPPLAVFWSKDHIVAASEIRDAWFVLALLAAAGASAYVLRAALVLWAPAVQQQPVATRGRGPMLTALAAAALATITFGALGGPVERLLNSGPLPTSPSSLLASLVAVTLGGVAVLVGRRSRRPHAASAAVASRSRHGLPGASRTGPRTAFAVRATTAASDRIVARSAWGARVIGRGIARAERVVLDVGVDGAARLIVRLSRLLEIAERRGVDAAVDRAGRGGLAAGRLSDAIEQRGVDALVDGLAGQIGHAGDASRRLQSGHLHEYLRDATLGVFALVVLLVLTALL
ncbi:NADH-quinone oxidoreductase subunit L [Patulibacter sp. NPDC049589]|uniref:NADH-quinone oxidoreductase subunit 5 family protein n=1 Tax=Patulibacter sp. NPDC049589 TaxID=3154731 RepID=UPI00343501D3